MNRDRIRLFEQTIRAAVDNLRIGYGVDAN
jgi:hypothetical protein